MAGVTAMVVDAQGENWRERGGTVPSVFPRWGLISREILGNSWGSDVELQYDFLGYLWIIPLSVSKFFLKQKNQYCTLF